MAEKRIVFSHTVRALIENVLQPRDLLSPELRGELRALGIDVERPTDIPSETWWKVLGLVSTRLAPGSDHPSAMEAVGRALVRGYAQTFLGKSAFMVLRLLGPRRGLARLTEQFQATNTGLTVISRELGPKELELSFRMQGAVPEPTYTRGILDEGLMLVGAKNQRVTVVAHGEVETLLRVSWD